jgi:hypothetical protein
MEALFIQPLEVDYPGAAGHYNELGNRWIADLLYEELKAIPGVGSLTDAEGRGSG